MSKTYATLRLLEHGPLTLREFREITGWNDGTCRTLLYRMASDGILRRLGIRHSFEYSLA